MRTALVSLLAAFAAFAVPAYALTPTDLNPPMTAEESSFYDTIKADPSAAQSFLATRDYVRKAQAVKDGSLPPTSFPAEKPAGFTVAYLLPDDPSIINDALGKYLSATWAAHPELLGR